MSRPAAAVLAAVAVATAVQSVPSPAVAGGFSISILGGRRTGMMANLAAPDDLTALFHNPAGLADQPGTRVHISGSTTFMATKFRMQALDPERFPEINPAGCGAGGNPACPWAIDAEGYYEREIQPNSYFGVLPYLGVSQDLGFLGAPNVVVSAAVTAPNLYGADLPMEAPTAYNFVKGYFAVISAMFGVAWRINPYVAVGASLSYNYMQMTYSQRLSLADVLRGSNPTDGDRMIADLAQSLIGDITMDYEGRDDGVGWNLGLLINPTPWMAIGLSYTGSSAASFDGPVEIKPVRPVEGDVTFLDAVKTAGINLPGTLSVEMAIPHSVQGGVNFIAHPQVEVAADARFWLYNMYHEQVIDPHYTPDPDYPDLKEPMTRESLSKDKGYGVSYEIAAGVLVRPWIERMDLELMTGLAFDASPVPDRSFSLDNPSMNQLCWTVGLRFSPGLGSRIALTYMLDWYMPRDIRTSGTNPPMNVRGEGLAHIPRIELEWVF